MAGGCDATTKVGVGGPAQEEPLSGDDGVVLIGRVNDSLKLLA
jgi:hypothetical protein